MLAEAATDRAPALLAKGREYAESRVVCGVHFLSDVEAGRSIAAAVIGRLNADPVFQRDSEAARRERSAQQSAR